MFYYLNLHNKKAVNDVLDSSENVVILYYSDMCGHCIQLKPAWNKLCDSIKNKKDINTNEYYNILCDNISKNIQLTTKQKKIAA